MRLTRYISSLSWYIYYLHISSVQCLPPVPVNILIWNPSTLQFKSLLFRCAQSPHSSFDNWCLPELHSWSEQRWMSGQLTQTWSKAWRSPCSLYCMTMSHYIHDKTLNSLKCWCMSLVTEVDDWQFNRKIKYSKNDIRSSGNNIFGTLTNLCVDSTNKTTPKLAVSVGKYLHVIKWTN